MDLQLDFTVAFYFCLIQFHDIPNYLVKTFYYCFCFPVLTAALVLMLLCVSSHPVNVF